MSSLTKRLRDWVIIRYANRLIDDGKDENYVWSFIRRMKSAETWSEVRAAFTQYGFDADAAEQDIRDNYPVEGTTW